ncbi:MAG: response regulator [Chitinophagaceae bacterium]|nr:response regulator [Chitinophagaceae bacterium]
MQSRTVIYIIDDDPDDQELLIEALREIDPSIDCFTAENGQEGLINLKTNAIPFPSLIFLDLNMPRVNGQKFLSELKNDLYLKTIPVVIYTTSSNSRDMEKMNELGAMDYLVKQFDYSILKEKLKTILSMVSTV